MIYELILLYQRMNTQFVCVFAFIPKQNGRFKTKASRNEIIFVLKHHTRAAFMLSFLNACRVFQVTQPRMTEYEEKNCVHFIEYPRQEFRHVYVRIVFFCFFFHHRTPNKCKIKSLIQIIRAVLKPLICER